MGVDRGVPSIDLNNKSPRLDKHLSDTVGQQIVPAQEMSKVDPSSSADASQALLREMMESLERPPMPLVDQDPSSTIGQFYAGRSVFVTGATGFVGKVNRLLGCETSPAPSFFSQ